MLGKSDIGGFSIVGIRDPNAVRNLDKLLEFVRAQMETDYPALQDAAGYRLNFHVYGRDGVMGSLEPVRQIGTHEVGVVSEVLAPTQKLALDIVKLVQYRFLFGKYPGQLHSGGGAALILDESLQPEHAAYQWTIDHLLPIEDPLSLFPVEMVRVG